VVRERARGDRNWIRGVRAEQSNILLDCPDVVPSISTSLKEAITAIGSPFAAALTGVLVKARRKLRSASPCRRRRPPKARTTQRPERAR
jgi:hypothetical protein